MKELIKFEIIRNLKRKEVKLLLVMLIMCELIFMTAMQKQSATEGVYDDSSDWIATDAYFKADTSEYLKKTAAKDVATLDKGLTLYHKYETEKKWRKMYFEAMKYNSYYAQIFMYDDREKLDEENQIYLRNANIASAIQKKYHFISIDEYAEIIDTTVDLHSDFSWPLHELQYFTYLYEGNLSPMTYSHIDSTTAFVQILRNLLALTTPILAALLFFNDRKEYHEIGVDKSMMIIPNVRKKYVVGKIIANVAIMMIVILGPILIFTILLGLFDHFKNINYPLLANREGLTQLYFSHFEHVYGPSSLQESIDAGITTNFGITYTSGNMLFNPYMEFIPLGLAIIPIILLFMLSIVLYVQLTMFIVRIIRNSYMALIVDITLILVLIILSPLPSMNIVNVINPLSYRDPGMNVMGTSYFPWLAGMLVVIAYNMILFIGNRIVFSRRYYD